MKIIIFNLLLSSHILFISIFLSIGLLNAQVYGQEKYAESSKKKGHEKQNYLTPACLGLTDQKACLSKESFTSKRPKLVKEKIKLKDQRQGILMTKLSPKGNINVLGQPLHECCSDPLTGFERDGFCHTGSRDRGRHVVCAVMTEEFLKYTKSRGNDLSTPLPQYQFPGLKNGDKWCLCALRWFEAYQAGVAPLVDLHATHEKTLEFVPLKILQEKALSSASE